MSMNIEKSRAEFELAYAEAVAESARYTMTEAERSAAVNGIKMDRTPTGYAFGRYDIAWRLWQASRKALVVELPPYMDEGEDWPSDCWNNAVTHCARSLHAAGIKTAGETRPPQWSGWACQYPGKMPRLCGDLAIAKLNCDSENGDRLIFLSAVSAAGITVKEPTR